MKNISVSKNLGKTKTGAISKANQAGYAVKGGSDKGMAHGSRPSHINNPEVKAKSAGTPKL